MDRPVELDEGGAGPGPSPAAKSLAGVRHRTTLTYVGCVEKWKIV
jgi:hypothetical protein